jgi:hypothetical protein
MDLVFNTTGELMNELGKNWENRDFKCTTSISVIPDILETELFREYSIVGYIPNKLKIDNNGIVSGPLGLLDEQEVDLPKNPLKPIGIDGTNWQNDGSVKVPLHMFYFKIKVTITYRDDDAIRVLKAPSKLLEVLTQEEIDAELILLEALAIPKLDIQSGIDYQLALEPEVKLFLESDEEVKNAFELDSIKVKEFISEDVSVKIIKNNNLFNTRFVLRYMKAGHKMSIGNDSYGLKNINDFLSRHPGTFEVLK